VALAEALVYLENQQVDRVEQPALAAVVVAVAQLEIMPVVHPVEFMAAVVVADRIALEVKVQPLAVAALCALFGEHIQTKEHSHQQTRAIYNFYANQN
jgi:hypothetical protein